VFLAVGRQSRAGSGRYGPLRFFTLDGSRLQVSDSPPYAWEENVGRPIGRVYESLDTGPDPD
jgi:hypothetical protein